MTYRYTHDCILSVGRHVFYDMNNNQAHVPYRKYHNIILVYRFVPRSCFSMYRLIPIFSAFPTQKHIPVSCLQSLWEQLSGTKWVRHVFPEFHPTGRYQALLLGDALAAMLEEVCACVARVGVFPCLSFSADVEYVCVRVSVIVCRRRPTISLY